MGKLIVVGLILAAVAGIWFLKPHGATEKRRVKFREWYPET